MSMVISIEPVTGVTLLGITFKVSECQNTRGNGAWKDHVRKVQHIN